MSDAFVLPTVTHRDAPRPTAVNQEVNSRSLITSSEPASRTIRSDKITAEQLRRRVVVYVRQSTAQQVLEHRESTARQYALVDRAVALGWPRSAVEVIDEDQGHSGSSAAGRSGFQRLLAEVSADRVGLILGLEMSRLARSCKDWHALLEVCAIFRVLLGDTDGLYDPEQYNDRLLLGLKGTMSEAELHILKSRLHQGLWNKARRGAVLNHAPIGYVRTPAGEFVIDPDAQVSAVVRLIFEQFPQRGSVQGLLKWLVRHDVKLPVRPHSGEHRGELEWRRPNRVTLLNLLHHPIYAGAYRWGHRQIDPRKKVPGRPGSGRTLKAPEACGVLIRDRFPAYITWEQFEQHQRQLAENSARGRLLSAPRRGPSVLAGLVVCGRCGQRMLVSYANGTGSAALRYSCQRAAIDYGTAACQSLSGAMLDAFVSERLLQAASPAALELSLAAASNLEQERARLDDHWQQRLTRSRYGIEQARRQYAAVDPEHRLVARELERRWEETLREDDQLQADYARFQCDTPRQLTAVERAQILTLSQNLPALWRAESTTPEDRQTIARLLLKQVLVTVEGDSDQVAVELKWTGGFVSQHQRTRPVQTYEQLSNHAELLERIQALQTAGRTLSEIAATLNAEGFHPPKRTPRFNKGILSRLLQDRQRRAGIAPRRITKALPTATQEWWLTDLATELRMPLATLHRWQRVGWIHSRKAADGSNRWVIYADPAELDRLRRLRVTPRGWPQTFPQELITPGPIPEALRALYQPRTTSIQASSSEAV